MAEITIKQTILYNKHFISQFSFFSSRGLYSTGLQAQKFDVKIPRVIKV